MSVRGDSIPPAHAPEERGDRQPEEAERFAATEGTLVGLVLCGGRSQRMGRDKASLELDGESMLERACSILERGTAEVLLAVGSTPRRIPHGAPARPQVLDSRVDAGPLAGLEAGLQLAHERHGSAWVLTLACDMPWAERGLFDELLASARAESADAALLSSEAGDEPLFAVYHTRLLPAVSAALDAGDRKLVAFHAHPLARVAGSPARAPRVVRVPAPSPDATRNVNTLEEFESVRARLERSTPGRASTAREARA